MYAVGGKQFRNKYLKYKIFITKYFLFKFLRIE